MAEEISEASIQVDIVRTLSKAGWFVHSVPNEGAGRDPARASRLVAMGMRSGVGDLLVWLGNGRVGYLEVKNRVGRQSEAQQTFQRLCILNRIPYGVVRSAQEALDFVERYKS